MNERKSLTNILKDLNYKQWMAPLSLTTYYGRMMSRFQILYAQKHRYSLKRLETLLFCRQNGWLIQNQELGRQSEKICAESATKNTPDTPQFIPQIIYSVNWPNQSKHFECVWKYTLLGVRSPCVKRFNFTEREIRCIHNSVAKPQSRFSQEIFLC